VVQLRRPRPSRVPNDPSDIGNDPSQWVPLGSSWTDYLAEQPYVDYQVALDPNNVPQAIEQTRWLSGLGIHGGQTIDGRTDPVRYLHGDLIGSTLMTTDQLGEPVSYEVGGQGGPVVSSVGYTAFGELVTEWTDGQGQLHCQVGGELPAGFPRYGYAGSWGYETGGFPPDGGGPPGSDPNRGIIALYGPDPDLPPITLMHVGYRWYDPAAGRFIQRDPIGLLGRLNAYLYCAGDPLHSADPGGVIAEEMGTFWPPDPHKSPEERAGERKGIAIGAAAVAGIACVACGVGAVARGGVAAAEGVVTYVVKTRATPGADGAISQIVKKYVDCKLVEVRHVVIRAGKIIHEHVKWKR